MISRMTRFKKSQWGRQGWRVLRGIGLSWVAMAGLAKGEARPNLIFIMADDLGYHDLGCYGQKKIRTPSIDALAAAGTRFTDVYSGSSVCAPARATLMTGKHSGHTRIRGNFPTEGGVRDMHGALRLSLAENEITLAEMLKTVGYTTAMSGKWGLGEAGSTGEPNRKGVDEWFGFLNQQHAHSYFPEYQWRNDKRVELPENLGGRREAYSHDLHSAFALEFIRSAAVKDAPFFLYLPYQIPHSRYEIPSTEPYAKQSWPREAKVHAAMITRLDRDIGRMRVLLDELGIADNTLVFFTSDNGAAKRWEGIFNSSHPFRGRKRDLYEGGIRVPMIVAGPGIPKGRTSDAAWYFPDILPTFAAVAGVPPESLTAGLDGVNILPSLRGLLQPELAERPMIWEFHESGFEQAARIGEWKAVRPAGKALELYHLGRDPAESRNLADTEPETAARMAALLASSRTPSRHWPVPGEAAPTR
jgi:arylsulfatase A-like enzyme